MNPAAIRFDRVFLIPMQRSPSAQESLVEKMREGIQKDGESIIGPKELSLLYADQVTASGQWNAIARIAISEGWCFSFFPDGSVRFAKA